MLYAFESGGEKKRNGGGERKRKSEKRQPRKCEPPAELKKRGEELITHLFFFPCSAPESRRRECKGSHFFICVIWIFSDLKQRRERDLSRLVGCESSEDSIFWYPSAVCLFHFYFVQFSHRFSPFVFIVRLDDRDPRPMVMSEAAGHGQISFLPPPVLHPDYSHKTGGQSTLSQQQNVNEGKQNDFLKEQNIA